MKTFWLYFGNLLVDAVRCPANATDDEVICHAINNHHACPCVSVLYPALAPFEILRLIVLSKVVRD